MTAITIYVRNKGGGARNDNRLNPRPVCSPGWPAFRRVGDHGLLYIVDCMHSQALDGASELIYERS